MTVIPWPLVGILVSLFVFFGGIIVTVIAALLRRDREHSDRRFEAVEKAIGDKDGDVARVREELSAFQLKVAEGYVHREDFVRVEGARSVILSKVQEDIGGCRSDITRLTTLIDERFPASPRA